MSINPEAGNETREPTNESSDAGPRPEVVTENARAEEDHEAEQMDPLALNDENRRRCESLSSAELATLRREFEDDIYLIKILTGVSGGGLIDEFGDNMKNDINFLNRDEEDSVDLVGLLRSVMYSRREQRSGNMNLVLRVIDVLSGENKHRADAQKRIEDLKNRAVHLLEGLSLSYVISSSTVADKIVSDMIRFVGSAPSDSYPGNEEERAYSRCEVQFVRLSYSLQQRLKSIDDILRLRGQSEPND